MKKQETFYFFSYGTYIFPYYIGNFPKIFPQISPVGQPAPPSPPFLRHWIHGHISNILMLSTLIPVVKDNLGNLCSRDNYRSITISSLVLKILYGALW